MSNEQNWRTEVNAVDYFGHQKKATTLADRRPVIRRASDLVGPGINANAVRISNFNDPLATYNGYFSAAPGASAAPNSTDTFVGTVTSDSDFGGVQDFTSMETGDRYVRRFVRSPLDASAIEWKPWSWDPSATPSFVQQFVNSATVASGVATALPASSMQGINLAGVFTSAGTSLTVLRSGVYQGCFTLNIQSGSPANWDLTVPDSGGTSRVVILSTSIARHQEDITFFHTQNSPSVISVTGTQSTGATRVMSWALNLSRIGDAV